MDVGVFDSLQVQKIFVYSSASRLDLGTTQPLIQWVLGALSPVIDRLCGLLVRVPGYRSRGPRFDSRRYQMF
jgi:hypothetical protein